MSTIEDPAPPSAAGHAADPPTVLLALAAAGLALSGAVHLALIADHAAAWALEGAAFAVVGALQLAAAAAVLFAPSRRVLVGAALVAAFPAGTWLWSSWQGLPVGPAAGEPQATDLVGWVTFGASVVAAIAALRGALATDAERPRADLPVPRWAGALAVAAVAGVGVLMTTPAGEHDHGAGHGHEAAGHDGAGHADEDGHSDEGGHAHAEEPEQPLTEEQRAALGDQLRQVQELALRYPTAADAAAAGWLQAGPVAAGSGAHYINTELADQEELDLAKPLSLLYSDTRPDAPVVGVMYYSSAAEAPEGFVGPNDRWHGHGGACYRITGDGSIEVPLAVDADITEAMCDEVDGTYIDRTGWMIHVWVAPGWESSEGVFSHDNPAIVCPTGTEETGNLATGCQPV